MDEVRAASKHALPLVKLAKFGDKRSDKASLRNDANVMEIAGIEGDYDAGKITIEEAVERLERHHILAVVVSTPSSTQESPRWRVFAPLARPTTPDARHRLTARLNGALGGVLAGESFTLSQAYFFGQVDGVKQQRAVTFDGEDGQCIDELDNLDPIAIGRPGRSGLGTGEVSQLDRLLRKGDGRRELLKSQAARLINTEPDIAGVKQQLRELAAQQFDPSDPVDWPNIDAMVCDLKATHDRKVTENAALVASLIGPVQRSEPLLRPVSVGDVFSNPASAPAAVWDGYVFRGVVTLLSAHGGTGKSYIALMLAVSTVLGRPLFGVDVTRCKALFVSLEDDANLVRHRLAQICRTWCLDPRELEGRLHIADGTEQPELFSAETRGAGRTTETHAELSELVQREGFGLVVVDNASDAYGGDEIQRRQVRAFMRSLVEVARQVNCAVLLLAHVDKNTSRSKPEGGEGYSGSTAWHNSARSRLFLTRNPNGTLKLEQQKRNLAQGVREELVLHWPEGGVPQLLDGTGRSDADEILLRQQEKRDEALALVMLNLLAEFESEGQYASTATTARNNVHALLRPDPRFQRLKITTDATKRVVMQCKRSKWLEPLEYRTGDRKWRQRWTVTADGRTAAGLPPLPEPPTAPTAPTSDECAQSAPDAGQGAPSAPTCAGGVGDGARTNVSTQKRPRRPAAVATKAKNSRAVANTKKAGKP